MLPSFPGSFICRKCAAFLIKPQREIHEIPSFRRLLRERYYSSHHHGLQRAHPLRLAVIGSGPAGFYAAYKVLSKLEDAIVDMYEKLPVPFGLVRFGVAPDHPEVKVSKNCQDKFTEVATSPRFNFVGNIAVGSDLPLQALKPHYDAILFAYGASKDRWLNIPGESTLKGIYSARAFVGWYDGLPEYANLNPDLTVGEEAVIIGQGNVALDVARILLTDVDTLRKTDITDYALDTLSRSRIKKVRVVGRRGPMQAAFTVKEVRELMNLPSVGFVPIEPTLLPQDPTKLPRIQRRLAQVLLKGSVERYKKASKTWELLFFLAPTAFHSSPNNSDQLSHLTLEKTRPESSGPFDPHLRVVGTGKTVDLPASVAFRSIGYKSEPLPGLVEFGIPFDEKLGIIPNDVHGRVLAPPSKEHNDVPVAVHVPGIYVAGWSKRGPTGVIASTMEDAFATAEIIVKDWADKVTFLNDDAGGSTGLGWDGVKSEAERRGLRRVSWSDWQRIDGAEKQRGKEMGKEREKFTSVEDMLKILD